MTPKEQTNIFVTLWCVLHFTLINNIPFMICIVIITMVIVIIVRNVFFHVVLSFQVLLDTGRM